MRRKIAFVYNVFMNLVAFTVIFPADASGTTLYWEDVFPLNFPAMMQEADKRLENYRDVQFLIKNSNSQEQNWIFAEYALEQARLHTVARGLTLSPAKLYCERASGRTWLDICLNHLLPSKVANLAQNSPNSYLRDFDYSLWFCYYNQNYALYHLKQSFYYLQFGNRYQNVLFTQPEEYRALLLSSICLDPPETNPSLAFKLRYPGAWVKYGCYQHKLPKAALDYLASRNNLKNDYNTPAPCGKILGYLESAGLGEIHEDKIVRVYAGEYIKRYTLPLSGRDGLY